MSKLPEHYEFGPHVRVRATFGPRYHVDLVVEMRVLHYLVPTPQWKEIGRFPDSIDPEALSKAVKLAQDTRRNLIEGEGT